MKIKDIISSRQLTPIINVALFAILIFSFHYFFRWWAYGENKYWPIEGIVTPIYEFLTNLLYENSVWALKHLTNYSFTNNDEFRVIYLAEGGVAVNYGCSGFKQFLQWIVLLTFFPGPWKHKLWFIPAGLVVIHLVNIFRIDSLVIILDYFPQYWKFTHDWLLRPFFYVVMFGMWVIWVEKFVDRK